MYYEVETMGFVNNAKVVKGINEKMDAESLRVIKLLPQHQPGKSEGKNVLVKYMMPINFNKPKPFLAP